MSRFSVLIKRIEDSLLLERSARIGERIAKIGGALSLISGVLVYVLESGDRRKAKEFQAWQVINTAKSGDGGRSHALADLISDDVDLSNVDLTGSIINNMDGRGALLSAAKFSRSKLDHVDFSCRYYFKNIKIGSCRRSVFTGAQLNLFFAQNVDFSKAIFSLSMIGELPNKQNIEEPYITSSNFDETLIRGAFISGVFNNVTFVGAKINSSTIYGASFSGVDFTGATLVDVKILSTTFDFIGDGKKMKASNLTDTTFESVKYEGREMSQADLEVVPGSKLILCRTVINNSPVVGSIQSPEIVINRDCPKPEGSGTH